MNNDILTSIRFNGRKHNEISSLENISLRGVLIMLYHAVDCTPNFNDNFSVSAEVSLSSCSISIQIELINEVSIFQLFISDACIKNFGLNLAEEGWFVFVDQDVEIPDNFVDTEFDCDKIYTELGHGVYFSKELFVENFLLKEEIKCCLSNSIENWLSHVVSSSRWKFVGYI